MSQIQRKTSLRDSYAKKCRERLAKGESLQKPKSERKAVSWAPELKPRPSKPEPKKAGLGKGKRMLLWDKYRARLKKLFFSWGITACELRLPDCKGFPEGFAHSKKRRFLVTEADWIEVALACNSCHDRVEASSHGVMARFIRRVIARRTARKKVKPESFFD